MSDKIDILFIINPISGTGKKRVVEQLIPQHLDKVFNPIIQYTNYAGHATILAKEAISNGVKYIVAVGGDGSVNEVAQALIGTNLALGIIPAGSGNGFARHLQIPLNVKAAIKNLNTESITTVDTGTINNEKFVGTAGVGFDAYISKAFDNANSRGFKTYFKLTVNSLKTYQERTYQVVIDGKEQELKGIILCFCNINQWGNNAFIAPHANLQSGTLKIALLKKMPLVAMPKLAVQLFQRKIHQSKYYQCFEGSTIQINNPDQLAHIDGDPIELDSNITINTFPASLHVIVPRVNKI